MHLTILDHFSIQEKRKSIVKITRHFDPKEKGAKLLNQQKTMTQQTLGLKWWTTHKREVGPGIYKPDSP